MNGSGTADQLTMTRVSSQFVGAAIVLGGYTGLAEAWRNVGFISANREGTSFRIVSGTSRAVTAGAESRWDVVGNGWIRITGTGGGGPLSNFYGSPTMLALGLLHELLHSPNLYGHAGGTRHSDLHTYAQRVLYNMGLNRGSCVTTGNFPACSR